ncbi:hypothetical protein MCM1_0863 [Methanosarcina barkeri CM1]|uniref:Transposase n=1 Tax=Methanosarcina barkeri CM1 TaxID=796385 RepID=A0A0G3C7G4_METBA|nr:hypothetical protein MCM1_0863 [Methanosarcina barkeri CM1]
MAHLYPIDVLKRLNVRSVPLRSILSPELLDFLKYSIYSCFDYLYIIQIIKRKVFTFQHYLFVILKHLFTDLNIKNKIGTKNKKEEK